MKKKLRNYNWKYRIFSLLLKNLNKLSFLENKALILNNSLTKCKMNLKKQLISIEWNKCSMKNR